jgi:hypothetical protein
MPNYLQTPASDNAISALSAAALEQSRLVRISADNTVADAGSNEFAIGVTLKEATAAGQLIAVELTRFRNKIQIMASGAITAGTLVKMAAASGANQRVVAWVTGTDAAERLTGVCLVGGADGALITVLV